MPDKLDSEGFIGDLPPIPEDEFCVFGTVVAYPEHADALEAVYAETTRLATSEPGTIYYAICRGSEDRNLFYFFERYAGRKAFEAHNEQPVAQKLIADKLFKGCKDVHFVRAIGPAAEEAG
ncbi:MAG: hypothetical protein M1820_005605 [Bogoriella megaspora]|nr:MAG: hypothetical protein M1820_005605 [Bogoriella megaspora]